MRRGRGGVVGLPARCLDRGRQKEIEQARILQVAVFVIVHLLSHGDGERLGQPTMDLPLDDHWVDPGAAVVERVKSADFSHAGVDIDIDDAHVGAERVGHVWRIVIADRLKPRLHPRRDVVVGGEGELGHGL